MTLVLANGCFDLLHIGHVRHLQQARSFGDYLVVGVTMDEYVSKGKGRPVQCVEERMEMLKALYCVSAVTMCKSSLHALEQWRPQVFAKGIDRKGALLPAEMDFCWKEKIEVRFTSTEKYSTTELIQRIKQCA